MNKNMNHDYCFQHLYAFSLYFHRPWEMLKISSMRFNCEVFGLSDIEKFLD